MLRTKPEMVVGITSSTNPILGLWSEAMVVMILVPEESIPVI